MARIVGEKIRASIFRVVFDDDTPCLRDIPHVEPLLTPAFRAGDPYADDTPEMQLKHCGGTRVDRAYTPYISCSKDLFWCLWNIICALYLKGTAKKAAIYMIADGKE